MPSIPTRGRPTYYERTGSGGPPLTLVHGGFVDCSAWGPFAGEVAAFADVVAYDVRGYGRSPRDGERWSLASCAGDLLALWDGLGIERGWVLGFSQGGLIAQQAACAAPGRVLGLVLVSTTARFGDAARARFAERAPLLDEDTLPGELDRHVAAAFTAAFQREHPDVLQRYRQVVERVDARTVANTMEQLAGADLTGRLRGVRCPVLAVRGGEDPIIGSGDLERLVAALPAARAVTFPGAGHNVPLERPDELAGLVREFVEAGSAARAAEAR